MDNELKGLVIEICILVLLVVIIVPICVDASNKYQEKKEVLLNGTDVSVDISNNGGMKKLTVYSNHNDVMRINLTMKINKFVNDYLVCLDNQVYDIRELDYTEDEEHQYYNLGIYEVDQIREFDFRLMVKEIVDSNETISYSFVTKGLL